MVSSFRSLVCAGLIACTIPSRTHTVTLPASWRSKSSSMIERVVKTAHRASDRDLYFAWVTLLVCCGYTSVEATNLFLGANAARMIIATLQQDIAQAVAAQQSLTWGCVMQLVYQIFESHL